MYSDRHGHEGNADIISHRSHKSIKSHGANIGKKLPIIIGNESEDNKSDDIELGEIQR